MLINTHSRRRSGSGRDTWLAAAAAAALLAIPAPHARAEEPDALARAHAQKIAITVCGTCHGPRGNSMNPKYPRLAGQNANYLSAQLKAFRAQTRGDPDALGYMWGMASQLDDATIDALAAYYAAQKAEPSASGGSAEAARGKQIYEHGVPAQGVPACSSCHGPDAHGLQDFPRLAGQHGQYVLKQLGSFQSNMRNVAIMHGVAQNLNLTDMDAVAAFLEAQP
ncbi:MAG TPA: c-type cytochrome [Steroidobacteraceae bacterium]|nr:cytochrome c4 [Gammaproteobacteria bacterium]HEV2285261.1 c-type cytochrome [Steroidobacteraceae bacterium]